MTYLHYLWVALDIGALGLFAWIVGTFAYCMATEQGSLWERILSAGKDSATIVTAKVGMAASALIAGMVQLANAAGDPQISQWMHDHLSPEVVGYIGIVSMLIVVLARKRTL